MNHMFKQRLLSFANPFTYITIYIIIVDYTLISINAFSYHFVIFLRHFSIDSFSEVWFSLITNALSNNFYIKELKALSLD